MKVFLGIIVSLLLINLTLTSDPCSLKSLSQEVKTEGEAFVKNSLEEFITQANKNKPLTDHYTYFNNYLHKISEEIKEFETKSKEQIEFVYQLNKDSSIFNPTELIDSLNKLYTDYFKRANDCYYKVDYAIQWIKERNVHVNYEKELLMIQIDLMEIKAELDSNALVIEKDKDILTKTLESRRQNMRHEMTHGQPIQIVTGFKGSFDIIYRFKDTITEKALSTTKINRTMRYMYLLVDRSKKKSSPLSKFKSACTPNKKKGKTDLNDIQENGNSI